MSTSEGPSTDRSGDSRSHHWRLVIDRNVAYHLTHNVGKSRNKSRKRCEHQNLNPDGKCPTRPSTIGLQAQSTFFFYLAQFASRHRPPNQNLDHLYQPNPSSWLGPTSLCFANPWPWQWDKNLIFLTSLRIYKMTFNRWIWALYQ
jgi:hypothetical protein